LYAHLRGPLARIDANQVVIDIGGVGYRVSVPISTLSRLPAVGGEAFLYIHTHVREDELALFGFATAEDQRVFELLLGVTGIGPKVALSVLSAMEADHLARAVVDDDTKTLVRIPGVGLKMAQRIVLELKDKLTAYVLERRASSPTTPSTPAGPEEIVEDVVDGLVNLGYNRNDARRAAEKAVREIPDKTSMPAALRAALNILTGAGGK